MANTPRILHLTDLHLPKPGRLFDEIDSYAQLEQVLTHAQPQADDLIVITGDVCAWDSEPETYTWLKKRLSALRCHSLVLPGNHDDSEMILDDFNHIGIASKNKVFGAFEMNGYEIIYLDTAPEWLCDEQMNWLRSLEKSAPRLLFMHHPPTATLSRAMDSRYPLRNRDEVWPTLMQVQGLKAVFCGHYHINDHQVRDHLHVYVTASTVYQIHDDENEEKMRRHINAPGYRTIQQNSAQELIIEAHLLEAKK